MLLKFAKFLSIEVKSSGGVVELQEITVQSKIKPQTFQNPNGGYSKVTVSNINLIPAEHALSIDIPLACCRIQQGTIFNTCYYLEYSIPTGWSTNKFSRYLVSGGYSIRARMSSNNLWLFSTVAFRMGNNNVSVASGITYFSQTPQMSHYSIKESYLIDGNFTLFPNDYSKIYMPLVAGNQNEEMTINDGLNQGSVNFFAGYLAPVMDINDA